MTFIGALKKHFPTFISVGAIPDLFRTHHATRRH